MSQPDSQTDDTAVLADRHIREIERRVAEQRARVQRMIVQGAPTQSAEDILTQLCATLRQMQDQRRVLPG